MDVLHISGPNEPYWSERHSFPTVCLDMLYAFVEKRPYIQGIVLYDGMLRALRLICPELSQGEFIIRQAKVMKETRCNSWVEAFDREMYQHHPLKGSEAARLDLVGSYSRYIALVFLKENEPVTERIHKDGNGHHITEIHDLGNGLLDCETVRVTMFIDLVRAIGEAHRDVVQESLSDKVDSNVRWAFFENMSIVENSKLTGDISIRLQDQEEIETQSGVFDYRTASVAHLGDNYRMNSCIHYRK